MLVQHLRLSSLAITLGVFVCASYLGASESLAQSAPYAPRQPLLQPAPGTPPVTGTPPVASSAPATPAPAASTTPPPKKKKRFPLLPSFGWFDDDEPEAAAPTTQPVIQAQALEPAEMGNPTLITTPTGGPAIMPDPIFEEPAPPPKIWSGGYEWGLNGTEGNSQVFNIRSGVNAKRDTDRMTTTFDSTYRLNTSSSLKTAHRLFLDGRNEWKLGASPWTYYIHGTAEYDEFRAFDVRLTMDSGLGYKFLDNDITKLSGRFGPGFSREIGGPDDRFIPEAVFGMSYSRKISDRQSFNIDVDYFPSMENFSEFRLNTKIDWQYALDDLNNLSIKLGIVDRYDSTPNGAKPNDFDYSAVLLYKF